jgi:hypothetical protein
MAVGFATVSARITSFTPDSSEAVIQIAMTGLMLRRLASARQKGF